MRLRELIDFEPKQSKQGIGDYSRRTQRAIKPKHIGSGSFGAAYATDSPKRLNQITKIGKAAEFDDNSRITPVDKIEKDGYLSWLSMVDYYKKQGSDNPYFPVIHDLKIMKGPDNKLHYRVNMEKLIPFLSPKVLGNEDLMSSLCDNMFGKDIKNKEDYEDSSELAEIYGDLIRYELRRGLKNAGAVKDEDLREALLVIKDVMNDNPRFTEDLHSGNIMWRITGHIPQLVLVDPIA